MNKVITINLNGNAFPLEENGYEALRSYLDTAGRRLEGNPDKEEIIADIEQAIADKFRGVLGPNKTVVVTREVEAIILEMGPVQDPSADESASAASGARPPGGAAGPEGPKPAGTESEFRPPPKRLHKIHDGKIIGGVCNGLAAYFGIDVTFVRIAFILLFLAYGTGILLYILMMIILPEATTPAEKAAATGIPYTAEEFIRRAKEGYYEGMKTFADKRAHREWKRKFKREMRGWKQDFQQEMHEHARQWRQNWHNTWSQPPRHGVGAFIVFPLLAVINAAIAIAGIFAVISLVSTGVVFGLALPFVAPLWVGILFLVVLYKIAVWPLKAVRHAFYFNGMCGPRYVSPFLGLLESFVWLGLLILVLWFAHHHRSEVRDALQHLPRMVRHAADSVRDWWNDR